MALIEASRLSKTYAVLEGRRGFWGAFQSLFARDYRNVEAVKDISFSVNQGEVVGFIGPNGAGKSTTIKMLTGILVPTSGYVRVGGDEPYRNRREYARRMAAVFGQRTKLWWDLPCMESFELHKRMYDIPHDQYEKNLKQFFHLLGIDEYWRTPVRQLSLGQRMRAELALSFLHDPEVVYLDEPTIGLDAVAKERIRNFLLDINRQRGVTLLITSHDMADIEKLCPRVLIIDRGRLVYDGTIARIREEFGHERALQVEFGRDYLLPELPQVSVTKDEGLRKELRFSIRDIHTGDLINKLCSHYEVRDISVREPEIESIIRNIYEYGIEIDDQEDPGRTLSR